jgi:CspA family cold shock protein
MTPGYALHSLDSPASQQHNAYTFFAGPWNRAFLGGNPQKKRGAHVERLKGTVKWFNNAKGYGFLGRDDGPDVFIHYSSITTEGYKSLQEGDKVEFEIVQGQKGPQAANVTKVP